MSIPWRQRKTRLAALVLSRCDEDVDGTAVDRLMHGQSVIGKTTKTAEIDALRFQDKDLQVVGPLEYGQFGVIEVVSCRLDNKVYVRKSIEKAFAMRTREQCSPQTERNILLAATLTDSPWAPHLLAAYQMPQHLHLVMDYAEGGNLWDVLESSPHEGKLLEADLKWWAPQAVSAIHWCHSQGFAHRDIKPHNFVLSKDGHILLIDFGSAAPLLPPGPDGSQKLPRKHCLVPCGTCDYISPEILRAHEEALVALEMEDDEDEMPISKEAKEDAEGYGIETDWWSLGAMLYELAYGIAPFFANEIRHTYQRILNHQKGLRFEAGISIEFQDLLHRLLTDADKRLGRRNIMEITDHPFFHGINWSTLPSQSAPEDLHLPQFTYAQPEPAPKGSPMVADPSAEEQFSQGFAFSAFFQSSHASSSPGMSFLRNSTTPRPASRISMRDDPSSAFIGFSWGPTLDAFPDQPQLSPEWKAANFTLPHTTPTPFRKMSVVHPTPGQQYLTPAYTTSSLATPNRYTSHAFITPVKPYASSPMHTIQRTSTLRRTAGKRNVSEREAMKQLVEAIGMSARKKVLESGRKPRFLTKSNLGYTATRRRSGSTSSNHSLNRQPSLKSVKSEEFPPASSQTAAAAATTGNSNNANGGTLRKELRFSAPIPMPNYNYGSTDEDADFSYSGQTTSKTSRLAPLVLGATHSTITSNNNTARAIGGNTTADSGGIVYYPSSGSEITDSEGPPSPSPSPRPGSAMSFISRRSATPTTTMSTFSARLRSGSGSYSASATGFLGIPSPHVTTQGGVAGTSWPRPWEDKDRAKDTGGGSGTHVNGKQNAAVGQCVPKFEFRPQDNAAAATSRSATVVKPKTKTPSPSPPTRGQIAITRLSRQNASSSFEEENTAKSRYNRRHSVQAVPQHLESDDDEYETEEEEDEEEDKGQGFNPAVYEAANNLWDELEDRHHRMMTDIKKLEQRLDCVSRTVGGC
ncbi:kinase-like protein [Coprinopsis marcescibilis]|uniref:Kinase-like protein n=1 Tax=Coprinopsis marcescibilis TaxID=230819 RepID=A0A5C3KIR1_COPMA|nr:kinase-like protein [Coprinopsis marcescibilis]